MTAHDPISNEAAIAGGTATASAPLRHVNVRDSMRFFVAGSVAGAMGVLVGHPFDLVKVRMQTQELVAKQQTRTAPSLPQQPRLDWPLATMRSVTHSSPSWIEGRSSAHPSVAYRFALHTRHQPPAFAMGGGIGSWNGRGPPLASHAFSSAFVRTTPAPMNRLATAAASVAIPRVMPAVGAAAAAQPLFASPLACFMSTLRTSGVRGLYCGMSSPLLLVGVQKSVAFGVFGTVSQHLQGAKPLPGMADVCVAGVAGGIANSIVLTPIDQIKISMQIEGSTAGSSSSMIQTAATLVRQQGWRHGVYGNFRATLLREVPMYTVYYSLYSALHQYFVVDHRNQSRFRSVSAVKGHPSARGLLTDQHKETLTKLLIGGVTGVGCWAACFPLDSIKSSMAAQTAQNVPTHERMNIRSMVKYMYRRSTNKTQSHEHTLQNGKSGKRLAVFPACSSSPLL